MKIPALVIAAVLCPPATDSARVQSYPGKAVRLVVGSAPGSAEQFAAFIKSETVKWTKVVKDSGAAAE